MHIVSIQLLQQKSHQFPIWETSEKLVIFQLSAVQKQFTIFSKFL